MRKFLLLSPLFSALTCVSVLSIAACAQTGSAGSQTSETVNPTGQNGNRYVMTIRGDQRCFSSNGLPHHETGTFPNRGNPNGIEAQTVNVCAPLSPQRASAITPIRGTMGIAINGVQFRPNTAGYYDPNGRRGHSRNGDKNWSLDIHGAPGKLGLDFNNAHVGRGGLYHYHGIATALTALSESSLVGYAGDGYEIHYAGETVQSGYTLKQGTRPSGPGGAYDGTYNEDYIYDAKSGDLDACNGGLMDGRYVYYITDSYPFVSRCLTGKVSADFNRSRHR